jgi:hypothetical protein
MPPLKPLEATMLFSRFAQSAAALALLTIGFAAPAHAQLNQPIVSGTWYEDRATVTSTGATFTVTFAQTPSDKFLNITNVSCLVQTTAPQLLGNATLLVGTTSGASDLNRPYVIMGNSTPQTIGGLTYYPIVQNGIFYKFGPGRFPSIRIFTGPSTSPAVGVECVIVGNLTDS